jgi:Flp pilus assembly CpaE family ATPase
MNYHNLLRVLDACRESHGYVVIDAPRLPVQAAADLASVTRVAIVVLQQRIRDVAYGKSLITLLTEQGMAADRILVLINHTKKRGGLLNAVEVRNALGGRPLFRVRNDWRKATKSVNRAQPLLQTARFSGLRRDYRIVAQRVQEWTSNGHQEKGGA